MRPLAAKLASMHPSRILTGAVLAALALASAAADAQKRGSAAKGPSFTVSGNASRTSVLRSRCKIPSALRATSIETTTTTYTYTFTGAGAKGRDPGRLRSDGETTYLFEREVEGESEYVKPETLGPTRTRVGGQESGGLGDALRLVREGKRTMLHIDLGPLAGGLRHTMTVPVPKKGGKPVTHSIEPPPFDRRLPRPSPGCEHSETVTIRGSITVGQR